MTIRRRVLVSGRVQGVFFRDSCRERAADAGLAGWVRNTPDGRVEASFEGEQEAVDGLIEWCSSGPRAADVDSVSVEDEEPTGESGFTVR
ncbi:MAG: acylphosphatase [Actinomycetota bacterium]